MTRPPTESPLFPYPTLLRSVVYKARQRGAGRIVALKLIRADRLEDFPAEQRQQWLERFRTEAQAAARLEHDHVVTVYEVGERSEEHTSELQSQSNLVCRLLL